MMSNLSPTGRSSREPSGGWRASLRGVLAGGAVMIAIMLPLAAITAALGWIEARDDEGWDLTRWLAVELAGGLVASVLAGIASRRASGGNAGPSALAIVLFCLAALESIELLRHLGTGRVIAPRGMVLIAPFVAAGGILLGGWRSRGLSFLRRIRGPWASRTGAARFTVPVFVLGATAFLALVVLPTMTAGAGSQVVAGALTLDFTITFPALVYVLLVRTRKAPWTILLPAFALGYVVAAATIPRSQQGLLEAARWLVVPVELAVVAYLVATVRRSLRRATDGDGDFVTRFRRGARDALGARVPADILTTEVAVLYHALRLRRAGREERNTYSTHREASYLSVLIGLVMILIAETFALHFLLARWSPIAAWVLTGLSVYALVWLVGDYRAMIVRPIRLTSSELLVRLGLRWEAAIPLAGIKDVGDLPPRSAPPAVGAMVVAVLGRPQIRLRLHRPVEVTGLYGLRRVVDELRLGVDDPGRFLEDLRGRMTGGQDLPDGSARVDTPLLERDAP